MNVKDRFLSYVAYPTASDKSSATCPSTPGQKIFAAALADELRTLGLAQAEMDENGYVYGFLPASGGCEEQEALGLIAHMDTAPTASGQNIHPRCLLYQGGDIKLESGEKICAAECPWMTRYIGQELIVTDGTTLLGADDKAGIAEIVTTCEFLLQHPEIPHRAIAICFTPDEEINRGTDRFDFGKFRAETAYTVDSGDLGLMEYECFNAAGATVEIRGFDLHSGAAKGRMKNAVLLAAELIGMLPGAETPAHTEGYEGFYHVTRLNADVSNATLQIAIRDHDHEKFEKRKEFLQRAVDYLNRVYGEGTCALSMEDNYYNMKEKILPRMDLVRRAEKAMRAAGTEPMIIPIRGGTDGAKLSYRGIPCPNLSAGGSNVHSVREFVAVPSMEKMVQVLTDLARSSDIAE